MLSIEKVLVEGIEHKRVIDRFATPKGVGQRLTLHSREYYLHTRWSQVGIQGKYFQRFVLIPLILNILKVWVNNRFGTFWFHIFVALWLKLVSLLNIDDDL